MLRSKHLTIAITAALILLFSQAPAMGDQWYLGIGGGGSLLLPNPEISSIDGDTDKGTVSTLILGRDFDSRSSGQFQLFSLGETKFDNADTATYTAAEAALLYRFYDSRDNQRGTPVFGAAIYGRFGLGFIDRDTNLSLRNEAPVYISAGAGIATYITPHVGLRIEAQYLDNDAATVTVSLIGRFGGLRRDSARRPPPIHRQTTTAAPVPVPGDAAADGEQPQTAELPKTAELPETAVLPDTAEPFIDETALPEVEVMAEAIERGKPRPELGNAPEIPDSDGDNVSDANDNCPQSPDGFPVGSDGCSQFTGDIEGLQFESDSVTLISGTTTGLDNLARLLVQNPDTRLELVSHTDNTGSEIEQSQRTRGRLRSIGMYLVGKGVRSNQLVLRSFAAKRPKADNNTEQGRKINNRVEVFESPRP